MAEDGFHVAALKRQRAHLKDVDADGAKLAENAELLRLAGVDADKLDKDSADDKPKARQSKSSQPVDRRAPEKKTADAPAKKEEAKLDKQDTAKQPVKSTVAKDSSKDGKAKA
jgi:hypothetical protein